MKTEEDTTPDSFEFPEIDIPEGQLLAILTQIEKENEEEATKILVKKKKVQNLKTNPTEMF